LNESLDGLELTRTEQNQRAAIFEFRVRTAKPDQRRLIAPEEPGHLGQDLDETTLEYDVHNERYVATLLRFSHAVISETGQVDFRTG
jgi:hypothetical protein